MTRRGLVVLWGLLAVAAHVVPSLLPAPAARADLPTESKRTIDYKIEARLDAKTREIHAEGRLTWENQTDEPVNEMRLHLYLNAFKNSASTFMRERKGTHRGNRFDPRSAGQIDLLSFRRKGGDKVFDPEKPVFWHGDDGNEDDQTVIVIPLLTPVAAGGKATFELSWKSKMPRVFARTGFGGDGAFFMVAQWFPKPGVWQKETVDGEEKCVWNCHQFHGNSEFYANYGSYDVSITVPPQFKHKVGASGKRVDLGGEKGGRENADGTWTYRHTVEHVHDFAWVCGEEFMIVEEDFKAAEHGDPEEQARIAKILGRPTSALDLDDVTVYFLLQPEHADQLGRHRKAVFRAIAYMGYWFGKYPYPTLTVVDPDHRARGAGGMEYPTLITGGTRYIRAEKQTSPEGVLIHEFGHQHFYGLVGSNEFRHAWMDEGMCTYATGKVLMKAYDGWTNAQWYGGFPVYGERPFDFAGIAAESRGDSLPLVGWLFDDKWKVPFGDVGIVRSIAKGLEVNHAPKMISLWGQYGEISPLAFVREVPPLTHLSVPAADAKEYERWRTAEYDLSDPIAGRRAWEYMTRRAYATNSYRRPSSSLRTLGGFVGDETMTRIMRIYCERYRFGHPEPEDFFAVANEIAKKDGKGDITWLLDSLFQSEEGLDFGIGEIDVRPAPRLGKKADVEPTIHESSVLVRRFEAMRMPMDVRIRFDDGTIREFLWDRDDTVREWSVATTDTPGVVNRVMLSEDPVPMHGDKLARLTPARGQQARWVRLRFRGPAKVVAAETDPHYVFSLDRNRTNDGHSTQRNAGASVQLALRALGWIELSNSFYGGL